MPNHPNRSRAPSVGRHPSPSEIRDRRLETGRTQSEAAIMVHTSVRAWQQWEAGARRMHPAMWELFCRKVAEG